MNQNRVYLALAVRIGIALFTRTFFQPDEYFQALEPAYAIVHGYGHITWEWLTPRPIRSILYPGLNIPIYWLLNVLRLDSRTWLGDTLLIAGPRLLHGCIAALTDIYTGLLTAKIAGERYASTALFLSLASAFHALSLSRSLSNSLETSLTTVAFTHYPWDASSNLSHALLYNRATMRRCLLFAALACMIRPTNAVIWIFLFGNVSWHLRTRRAPFLAFLQDAVVVAVVSLSALCLVDSIYYRRPTLTPLNFILTNLSSVSVFYGGNTWHFYITAALPILCATVLPYVVLGIRRAFTTTKRDSGSLQLASYTVAWTISIYSMSKHKEWRFIHPLLPLLYILAAKCIVDQVQPPLDTDRTARRRKGTLPTLRTLHMTAILAQIPVSLFLVLFWCSAPISVMTYIRNVPSVELLQSVGFLMPCHSTPGHAYFHREELRDGRLWALGCEPPLRGESLATYRDQTDIFYDSPIEYLRHYFPARVDTSFPVSQHPASLPGTVSRNWSHEWPRHLVFFGQLLSYDGMEPLLLHLGYKEVWRKGFDWEGDDKRKGGVRVWKWQ